MYGENSNQKLRRCQLQQFARRICHHYNECISANYFSGIILKCSTNIPFIHISITLLPYEQLM